MHVTQPQKQRLSAKGQWDVDAVADVVAVAKIRIIEKRLKMSVSISLPRRQIASGLCRSLCRGYSLYLCVRVCVCVCVCVCACVCVCVCVCVCCVCVCVCVCV